MTDIRESVSVPLPVPWRVRALLLGMLASLLLAGYLRFDAGHAKWARLLVAISLASFSYSVFRLASRIDKHYRTRPWDFPIDQSRVWTYEQERTREVRAQTARRRLIGGIVRLTLPLAACVYGALVLLPGLPPLSDSPSVPEFLLWFIIATVLSLTSAVYLLRRNWRRTRAE